MIFGLLLGKLISPIVMGIIFFGLFTPTSLIMKMLKRDELRLKFEKKKTYWISRNFQDIAPDTFKKPILKLKNMEFIKELWAFLKVRKKLWLSPIITVMMALGGLLLLAQGSVVAPFIYTLF